MSIARLKKTLAGMSVVAVSLSSVGSVLAAYRDVPSGVWYEDAVNFFLDAGYLDAGQPNFRGGDVANRAEFIKLVVELNGGILSTPPAVPSFNDVPASAWYYGYMEDAAKEGWVRGDGDCYGTKPCYARPGGSINRAEAAALIVRAFGLEWRGDAAQFVDNPSGQWYTDAIQTAADYCVLQGDDGSGRVRPGDNMNRAEMVVMLDRADQDLQYGADCKSDSGTVIDWPGITDAMATSASTLEIEFSVPVDPTMAEDVAFYAVSGDDDLVISEAALVTDKVVELTLEKTMTAGRDYTVTVTDMETKDGELFSDSMSFVGFSPVVKGDGVLELSVASSNPAGDSIPKGAQGVSMLSVDLSASCDDDVIIQDLTIVHQGFGAVADITGVYGAIDGGRVTRKRTVDAEDQTADLHFSKPLTIPACGTRTLDLVGDFLSTATTSGEHNLAVELPSDVKSNAKEVSGNFPLLGNTFRVAAVTSGQITLTYRTISPDEVEVGNTAVVVGKWELSTDAVEDQTIYSMTIEQNSTASDGDLVNIAVRRTDGTVLTNTVSQFVGDFATLVFDPPFTILEGDKITLEVISDIAGGAADTVILHFEETSDIFAVGSLYGYGVNGQLYGSQISLPTETSSLPDTVTIDAGEFNIEIDGPPQQTYTRDDKDVVLAKIKMMSGGESVDIKDLYVAVQGQTSTGVGLAGDSSYDNIHELLEDVEIRDTLTGRTVSAVRLTGTSDFGTGTAATATYQIYRFDDFIVKGDEVWEFRGDFIDNGSGNRPLSGDKFRIHICTQDTVQDSSTGCDFGGILPDTTNTSYNMKIEGLSTGDAVKDVRPGGTVTGNFQRVANAELVIAVKQLATADTSVKNAKNVNLFRFEARAGEAEDILLTKATFDAESGSLLNGQNYTLWVDTDGDSVVDTILEKGVASQTSKVSFQEMAGGGYVVPAEETVVFEVHSDISASLTNDDLQLKFATGTADQADYIEAEEVDDGSNLSGIKSNGTCQTDTDATAESNCAVIVSTFSSTLWALVSQGDLFVIKDTTPVRERQLLGGTLGDALLRLQFRAQNEDVDVTDIQFTSSGGQALSVDRLELYKEGETTKFAEATIGGCGSDDVLTHDGTNANTARTFCANMESRQLVVAEGQNLNVIVRPRIKTDLNGATSNDVISFFISKQAVSNEAQGSGAIRARGVQSNNNLDKNSGDATAAGEIFIGRSSANATNVDIVGLKNVTVLSKVTSITNANPDPDNTNVPTGITSFGQFKFTSASNANTLNGLNKFVLSGVIFSVNASQVTLNSSGFYIYNYNDSTQKKSCTPYYSNSTTVLSTNYVASGAFVVECKNLDGSVVNTTVDQGASVTFVLEGNVTNSKIGSNTSTLQASIQSFTQQSRNTFSTAATTNNHLMWVDRDTSDTPFRWIEYPQTVVNSTSYKS